MRKVALIVGATEAEGVAAGEAAVEEVMVVVSRRNCDSHVQYTFRRVYLETWSRMHLRWFAYCWFSKLQAQLWLLQGR